MLSMPRRPPVLDLISLGDATTDVFLEIDDASVYCHLREKECLLCIEYADKIPVRRFTELLGVGNAANNAIGSARLGLRTALWAILGDDDAGRKTLRTVFIPERVQPRYIEFDPRHGTNFSTVINFHAERTILVYHQPRTYRLPTLAPASWAYLTSMGKGWETIIPDLLSYLQRTGTKLAFNPGTHQLLSSPRKLRKLLAHTEALILNTEESSRLLHTKKGTFRERIHGLRKLGPRLVVVTDGPKGSYAGAADAFWYMPIMPVPVVERTGCGDSFSTGFLAALFRGASVPEAMRWGTANAASVIQYIGAREGLLTERGMRRLLRRHARVVARPLAP